MKSKAFNILVVSLILAFVIGCGNEKKVEELLKHGDEAQQSENYEQAIKDYSEAIKLDPKSATAYVNRGLTFGITGEFDKAIDDSTKAIRFNPNETLAYETRGHAYFGKQQFNEAISNYNVVVEIEPDNGRVLKARGQAYYFQHAFEKAIDDLTEALKFLPDDSQIYDYRGDSYSLTNEIDNALSDFNNAIRLNPKDSVGLFGRGQIYSKTGSFTNAIQDFETVIKLKPKAVEAYNLLAWLLATCPDNQIRDGKRAVELAMKACDLVKWKNYAYVDTLAAAYAETGDFEQAVKYQKQAASMDGIPEDNGANILNRIQLYLQHKPYRKSNNAYD